MSRGGTWEPILQKLLQEDPKDLRLVFEQLINQAGEAAAATGVAQSRHCDQVVLGQRD